MLKANTIDEIAEQFNKKGLTVLYFGAPWCGACQTMKSIVMRLDNDTDATFMYVNTDDAKELVNRYKVSSLPTFVLVKNLEVVGRFSGVKSEKSFAETIEEAKNA